MMWQDGLLTISIPELHWGMVKWFHLIGINIIYGFVTHMHSLPAIHRFNKQINKQNNGQNNLGNWTSDGVRLYLNSEFVFAIFLIRLINGPTVRLGRVFLGSCWMILTFISYGIPETKLLKSAWAWHWTPEELLTPAARSRDTGPGL